MSVTYRLKTFLGASIQYTAMLFMLLANALCHWGSHDSIDSVSCKHHEQDSIRTVTLGRTPDHQSLRK